MRHGRPGSGWRQCTPGPSGWLKKTKSASERTFPLGVTSSAERSAGAATSTVTTIELTASAAFWPLTRMVGLDIRLLRSCPTAAGTEFTFGFESNPRRPPGCGLLLRSQPQREDLERPQRHRHRTVREADTRLRAL